MTGFIRGLFGRKNNQQGGSFYLSEDDAKSLGDIDFMRSSKTVRRTFAKKKGETEEKESVKSISSMQSTRVDEKGLPKAAPERSSSQTSPSPQPTSSSQTSRRKPSGDGMDMFRNMAKDIRK
ncbi:MAG: hypothetical protein F6J97_19860 [Leptolyngbya sp. SIO4C1]|nr:hypothetical protein [Leptolyngbya sp. SIO4C1]